jgi:uncharacterized membrane protein
MKFTQKDIEEHKYIAMLGYIVFIFPLFTAKHSALAQFHARQGLALAVFWGMLIVIQIIPLFGQLIGFFLAPVLTILTLIGMFKAQAGEAWMVPVLGKWASELKI